MTDRLEQFHEDRALRNAAKAVLMADVEHVRLSLSGKGMATRVAGRIGDGALDVFEVAKTQADDKRGVIAVLLGAIVLWLARNPILEVLGLDGLEPMDDGHLEDGGDTPTDTLPTDEQALAQSEEHIDAEPMQTECEPDGGDDNEHPNN